jgi:hypothetical protein
MAVWRFPEEGDLTSSLPVKKSQKLGGDNVPILLHKVVCPPMKGVR